MKGLILYTHSITTYIYYILQKAEGLTSREDTSSFPIPISLELTQD